MWRKKRAPELLIATREEQAAADYAAKHLVKLAPQQPEPEVKATTPLRWDMVRDRPIALPRRARADGFLFARSPGAP
jgi:hypothetical protein